jgi:hypothetical protein
LFLLQSGNGSDEVTVTHGKRGIFDCPWPLRPAPP